jgi:glutathione S-transferase
VSPTAAPLTGIVRPAGMYRLYVIPGSHACRAAMLMLGHKDLEYERVDFVTMLHPLLARLHGFDAGGQTRAAGNGRSFGIRLGDTLGTVPALAAGSERVSTNHGIARWLDEHHPDPPLLPSDPDARAAVEEAERWANETLQMVTRRLTLAAAVRDPAGFARASGDGRMGYLLYPQERLRRLIIPRIGRGVFAAGRRAEGELLAELPSLLDRIDAWIDEGVVGGARPNVADLMVAPCLALVLYRPDVRPLFEGRPALALVDRLLPEPARDGWHTATAGRG